MAKTFWAFTIFLAITVHVFANATIPKADVRGSKDSPLLKRYEGSFIVSYEHKSFDQFDLPLSKLEPVADKRTGQNNQVFEPKKKQTLEGERTHLVYLLPADRSPLEVLRNYQDEIQSKGGKILFECKAAECGGSETRSSSGGGGDMSLSMYLLPQERITYHDFTNDYCSVTSEISDQRYFAAELPSDNAHVSVLTYTLHDELYCKEFNTRTIAMVDIIQEKAREQKMVTVNAEEMASKIANTGSVALYGIYFDFNKADLKPESDPALQEIAKLLKGDSSMKLLVVGHTDNVGTFDFNMGLSQRRAAAVVAALTTKYEVGKARLTPVGVSFAAPVASNKTEDGRAKNRRVELVGN